MSTRYVSSYVNGHCIRQYGGISKKEIAEMVSKTLQSSCDVTEGGLIRAKDIKHFKNDFEIRIMKRNKKSKHGIVIKGYVSEHPFYLAPHHVIVTSISTVQYRKLDGLNKNILCQKLIGGKLDGYV